MTTEQDRRGLHPRHAIGLFLVTSLAFVAPALVHGPTMGAVDIVTSFAPYDERSADPVPPDNPIQGDQAIQIPLPAEFWAGVRSGDLQLWEPDVAGGTPLLPAVYNRILSPLNLGFAFLPAAWAPTFAVFLGMLVAQMGTYALARRIGLGVAGAMLAGVGYAFSGPLTAFALRFHEFFLLPAWLFAVHGLITDDARRWGFAALTGVFTAGVWLSGFPGAAVMSTWTALGWGGYLLVSTTRRRLAGARWPALRSTVLAAGLAVGAGLLVAALQLLPTLEFLDVTLARTRTYGLHHLPSSALAMVFSGRFFGAVQDADWWHPDLVNVIESASGFGIVVLLGLLTIVAGVRGRARPDTERVLTWFVAPLAVVLLHTNYLARPIQPLLQRLPLLDETLFTRSRAIGVLMLVLLGGFALDRVLDHTDRDGALTPPPLGLRVLTAYVPALVAVGTWHAVGDAVAADQVRAVARDLVVPGMAVVIALAVGWALRRRPGPVALALVVALAVELQFGALGLTPAADRFYPDDPALDVIAADTGPGGGFRFFDRPNLALYGHTGAYLDLSDALAHWPTVGGYQQLVELSDPLVAETSAGKAVFEPTFSDQLDLASPALDRISAGWYLADLAAPPEQVGPGVAVAPGPRAGRTTTTRAVLSVRGLVVDAARADARCQRGWVEVTVGGITARRLLRELPADLPWTFPVPDLALPAGTPIDVQGTHCDLVDGATDVVVALPPAPDTVLELVSVDGWQAYRRPSALPRLSLATAATVIPDADDRLRHLATSTDDTVVLEAGTAETFAGGRAQFMVDTPDRVEVAVDSDGPGLLVLRDVHAPGWQVTVDGLPADLRRVDHAFRGVAVPAGTSTVAFTYAPASFRTGAWLALAGIVLLVVMGAKHLRTGQPSRSRRNLPV